MMATQADVGAISLGSHTHTTGHGDTCHVISSNWLKLYAGWGSTALGMEEDKVLCFKVSHLIPPVLLHSLENKIVTHLQLLNPLFPSAARFQTRHRAASDGGVREGKPQFAKCKEHPAPRVLTAFVRSHSTSERSGNLRK